MISRSTVLAFQPSLPDPLADIAMRRPGALFTTFDLQERMPRRSEDPAADAHLSRQDGAK